MHKTIIVTLSEADIMLIELSDMLIGRVNESRQKPKVSHLQLIEYKSRYPPHKMHIIDGKMSEKP